MVAPVYPCARALAGLPVENGVNDPRLGSIDMRVPCKTCKNSYSGAPVPPALCVVSPWARAQGP